ncbi:hypothetical protein [Amycolatopsis minnesotensis]|uniref:Uncharacterized protein n=1 Tax=Amycolatopsis minnesotensis TaxID=337894 RepID=A0ABP5C4X1_9PSEU
MGVETDLSLPGGRTPHVYDTGGDGGPAIFWHHGTPNTGAPPEPLFPAPARHGTRRRSCGPTPGEGHISVFGHGAEALDWLGADA